MIRNIVIAFIALGFGAGALPAAGQTMQKYVTPDGKTVYSDRPIPGARLVDQIAPAPPVDPKAAAEAQARAKENAERANASATKRAESGNGAQQGDAAAALARAKEQLEKGKEPLGACIDTSAKVTCQCWGDPDEGSRELLAGFGTTYHQTAVNAFVLNPRADKDSLV